MIDTNFKRIKYTDNNQGDSRTIYTIDSIGEINIKEFKIIDNKKTIIRKETKYADPNYFETFFKGISKLLSCESLETKEKNSTILVIEYNENNKNIKLDGSLNDGKDCIEQIFWRLMRTADTVFLD